MRGREFFGRVHGEYEFADGNERRRGWRSGESPAASLGSRMRHPAVRDFHDAGTIPLDQRPRCAPVGVVAGYLSFAGAFSDQHARGIATLPAQSFKVRERYVSARMVSIYRMMKVCPAQRLGHPNV